MITETVISIDATKTSSVTASASASMSNSPAVYGLPAVAVHLAFAPARMIDLENVTVALLLRSAIAEVMGKVVEVSFITAMLDVSSGAYKTYANDDLINTEGNNADTSIAIDETLNALNLAVQSFSLSSTPTHVNHARALAGLFFPGSINVSATRINASDSRTLVVVTVLSLAIGTTNSSFVLAMAAQMSTVLADYTVLNERLAPTLAALSEARGHGVKATAADDDSVLIYLVPARVYFRSNTTAFLPSSGFVWDSPVVTSLIAVFLLLAIALLVALVLWASKRRKRLARVGIEVDLKQPYQPYEEDDEVKDDDEGDPPIHGGTWEEEEVGSADIGFVVPVLRRAPQKLVSAVLKVKVEEVRGVDERREEEEYYDDDDDDDDAEEYISPLVLRARAVKARMVTKIRSVQGGRDLSAPKVRREIFKGDPNLKPWHYNKIIYDSAKPLSFPMS